MKNIFGIALILALTGCTSPMTTAIEPGASEQASSTVGCRNSGACVAHLVWDGNASEEEVTGYRVEYGKISKASAGFTNYEYSVQVANITEAKLVGLEKKNYYISIRAISETDSGTELSDLSEETVLTSSLLRDN